MHWDEMIEAISKKIIINSPHMEKYIKKDLKHKKDAIRNIRDKFVEYGAISQIITKKDYLKLHPHDNLILTLNPLFLFQISLINEIKEELQNVKPFISESEFKKLEIKDFVYTARKDYNLISRGYKIMNLFKSSIEFFDHLSNTFSSQSNFYYLDIIQQGLKPNPWFINLIDDLNKIVKQLMDLKAFVAYLEKKGEDKFNSILLYIKFLINNGWHYIGNKTILNSKPLVKGTLTKRIIHRIKCFEHCDGTQRRINICKILFYHPYKNFIEKLIQTYENNRISIDEIVQIEKPRSNNCTEIRMDFNIKA